MFDMFLYYLYERRYQFCGVSRKPDHMYVSEEFPHR